MFIFYSFSNNLSFSPPARSGLIFTLCYNLICQFIASINLQYSYFSIILRSNFPENSFSYCFRLMLTTNDFFFSFLEKACLLFLGTCTKHRFFFHWTFFPPHQSYVARLRRTTVWVVCRLSPHYSIVHFFKPCTQPQLTLSVVSRFVYSWGGCVVGFNFLIWFFSFDSCVVFLLHVNAG